MFFWGVFGWFAGCPTEDSESDFESLGAEESWEARSCEARGEERGVSVGFRVLVF